MPKRSNEFQRLVKYIYEQITPTGGRVMESALLPEPQFGEREVDILVEQTVAGHEIRISVECRNRGRKGTIEWIDSLIGKYLYLKVNKVVAVSRATFTGAAKAKANFHGIDLITVNEALSKDWVAAIEAWKVMTHSFTLMRITTLKSNGEVYTNTEIAADGMTATHKDQMSEYMHNVLKPHFMEQMSTQIGAALEAKIAERWQHYIDDPTPRWAEFVWERPGLMQHGQPLDVERVVFGVGTFFHVGSPSNHFALREHALSEVRIKMMNSETILKMVTDKTGKPISLKEQPSPSPYSS